MEIRKKRYGILFLIISLFLFVLPCYAHLTAKAEKTASKEETTQEKKEETATNTENKTLTLPQKEESTQSEDSKEIREEKEKNIAGNTGEEENHEKVPQGQVETRKEYRAVWFCFSDFSAFGNQYPERTKDNFIEYFTNVVKNSKEKGMNSIIVQVRPRADAIYPSKYFPWSSYFTGTQGKDPGYDPLAIMVTIAHENGLSIEAWVNPYRVGGSHESPEDLAENNPAKKWMKEGSRNVLLYDKGKYFNPSSEEVRELIVHGVEEIVENYDVDGIHMDDYFYPAFSPSNVASSFDAPEYDASQEKKDGLSIADYRRKQVNILVKDMYKAIKDINPDVRFGISPAGELNNLRSEYTYYVDIDRWMEEDGYIDYVCPQIYWGFTHPIAPYDKILNEWVALRKNPKIDLYVGLATYRVGHSVGANSSEKAEWLSNPNILKEQIDYGREKNVDGFFFFDYEDFLDSNAENAMTAMKDTLLAENRTITKETTNQQHFNKVILVGDSTFSDYTFLVKTMNDLCKDSNIEILHLSDNTGNIAKLFAENNKVIHKTFKNEEEIFQYCRDEEKESTSMMIYFSSGDSEPNDTIKNAMKMKMDIHIISFDKGSL